MSLINNAVTLDSLSQCGYKKIIQKCEDNIDEYASMFRRASDEAKERGELHSFEALKLLSKICSSPLNAADINQPYKPIFTSETRRTSLPSDFEKDQAILLGEFAAKVEDAELAARLADFSWLIVRKGNIKSARIAIDSYVKAIHSPFCQKYKHKQIIRLERAIRIAKQINQVNKVQEITKLLNIYLNENNPDYTPQEAITVCQLLLDLRESEPDIIAQKAFSLAVKYSYPSFPISSTL